MEPGGSQTRTTSNTVLSTTATAKPASCDETTCLIPKPASTDASPNSEQSCRQRCLRCVFSTFAGTLLLAFELAIPISMIVVGAIYRDACPAAQGIQFFLIAYGSSYLFYFAIQFLVLCKSTAIDHIMLFLILVFELFSLSCLITGTYWVFSITPDKTNPASSHYCHPTLYYFAYAIIICIWIVGVPFVIIKEYRHRFM